MVKRLSSSGSRPGGAPAPHQPEPQKWLENIGLIVIVILILAIILTRYWRNIHWSIH